MSLDDRAVHERRERTGRPGLATIEVGHAQTRTGIIVQVEGLLNRVELRGVLERAFDDAAAMRASRRVVTDPGWWAIIIGRAALRFGRASVQRVPERGALHAVVLVERGRMLEEHGAWPLVRLGAGARHHLLDLRGPAALALGPSDAELAAYGEASGVPGAVHELRRLWDLGALEWESDSTYRHGRRGIRAAR